MADWVWLPELGRYRDLDSGRFVAASQARVWAAQAMEQSAQAITDLSNLLVDGQLSTYDWTLLVRDELKDAYVQEYVLARGGLGSMTQADWGRIGGMLREQYRYLDRFAQEIVAGKVPPGRIPSRAAMYGRSAREAYERAARITAATAGKAEVHWVLGEAEHCDDCIAFADMGWQRVAEDPYGGAYPGSGQTQCLTNCACLLEYR